MGGAALPKYLSIGQIGWASSRNGADFCALRMFHTFRSRHLAAPHRVYSSRDRIGCAPWKGGAFQWVQVPPGNRSSRKQPEQSWR
jgi:hypothetical protein